MIKEYLDYIEQCKKNVAETMAIPRECLVQEKWQPIETAPKMKVILLYAGGLYIGHWNETNNKWWTTTDGTKTSQEIILNSWCQPTHWMPLPKAPKINR